MKKFNSLFFMGFTIVMIPVGAIIVMMILSFIIPKNGENEYEREIIYDTVKVESKVMVYDTVKIEKIKFINKVNSEKDSTNNLENIN